MTKELTKYKICPDCGKKNSPGLIECRYCEADLTAVRIFDDATKPEEEIPVEPAAKTEKTELVKICDCGAENPPQARKCKACGEDISDIIATEKLKACEESFFYELHTLNDDFSVVIDKPLIVLGRESELKDYLKNKPFVSRQHAELTVIADKVFIKNLSKTNKTFINNEEILSDTPVQLHEGDEIGLGGKIIAGNRQEQAAYFIFRVKI